MLSRSILIFFAIFVSVAFAKPEDEYQKLIKGSQIPSMKWIQENEKFLWKKIKSSEAAKFYLQSMIPANEKIALAIADLIKKHSRSFIVFHARDSEALYTYVDAMSLHHPRHEEFMKSFAVLRTSSSAGFASGSGGHPTIYKDPQAYVKYLEKSGLDVNALIEGRETVVALIHAGGGVQAVGALATLLAAFKDRPDFRQIVQNVLSRYVIYIRGQGRLPLTRKSVEDFVIKNEDLSVQGILDAVLGINPINMDQALHSMRGYINWTGTALGFNSDGEPKLGTDSATVNATQLLLNTLATWAVPSIEKIADSFIDERLAERNRVAKSNFEEPIETNEVGNIGSLDDLLIQPYATQFFKLDEEGLIFRQEGPTGLGDLFLFKPRNFSGEAASFWMLGVQNPTNVNYLMFKKLAEQGVIDPTQRPLGKFLLISKNNTFLDWVHLDYYSGYKRVKKYFDKLIPSHYDLVAKSVLDLFPRTRTFLLRNKMNAHSFLSVLPLQQVRPKPRSYNIFSTLSAFFDHKFRVYKVEINGKNAKYALENPESKEAQTFNEFLNRLADEGIGFTHFDPENFVFNREQWVTTIPQQVQTGMSHTDIAEMYIKHSIKLRLVLLH